MIAVTLRALACRSPSWSLIADLKLFARFASTAAGRACRPVGFGITIASDVTVVAAVGRQRGGRSVHRDREQRVLSRRHAAARALQPCHALAVGDDDLREQALRVRGEKVEIELDQRRRRLCTVSPTFTRGVKPCALQRHGVDADVHQHFHALRRAQRHRMAGGVQRDHFAVARRQRARRRSDRSRARRRPSSARRPDRGCVRAARPGRTAER